MSRLFVRRNAITTNALVALVCVCCLLAAPLRSEAQDMNQAHANAGITAGTVAMYPGGKWSPGPARFEFQLDANPDLMVSVALTKYGKLKIHRKPYFRLEFTNGAILYFRPAGAYGDAFRSLHVNRVWVDEGAWLTERAWKALRQ